MTHPALTQTQPSVAIESPEQDYTRAHLAHASRTRGIVSSDPANEMRRTREMPVCAEGE